MLEFQVLIQRPLWPIRSLTCLNRTPIMPLYLICSSSKSFFPIFITLFSLLDFLPLFLEFCELTAELIPLIDEFSHLREQDNISHIESTIFMIVVEIGIAFSCHNMFRVLVVKINKMVFYLIYLRFHSSTFKSGNCSRRFIII